MSAPGQIVDQERSVFVCVPSYNHAQFIEKCLTSIISQTLRPKKLLVIDDGSRDDSVKIIEGILDGCPFDSELIARENRGLCATLNQGLELSSGEHFAYIGSDDFWLPRFLAERVKLMSDRPAAVIGYGHAYLVDDEGRVFGCTADYKDDWARYADGDPTQMLVNGVSPVSSTVMYRRDLLTRSPWNEKAKLEDYEMYVRLMPLGEFAFDPQPLSAWRHHSYNTSGDLMLMHTETIAAQERNKELFRIDAERLLEAQRRSRFRYARVLLQNGRKREALSMFRQSWRSAASLADLAKPAIQLLMPTSFLKFYQRQKRKRQTRSYVDVKI